MWSARLVIDSARLGPLLRFVSQAERQAGARFHLEADRQRFLAIRGIVRQVLASYLDVCPESLRITQGAHGKPFLPDFSHIQFSLSHSEDLLLLGVARGRSIGVDLERIPAGKVAGAVGRRALSAPEWGALQGERPARRPELFARLWTRKEAYLKADGRGMSIPLDRVDVWTSPGRVLLVDEGSGGWSCCQRWMVRAVTIAAGYRAAVVVERESK